MRKELDRHLIIPTIVITEYINIAGRQIGLDAAITRINTLEDWGAKISDIDKATALEAGKLLMQYPDTPIADAVIASTYKHHSAEYILTSDEHIGRLGCKTKWL